MSKIRSAIFKNAIRYYEALGPLYYQGTFFDPGTLWADLFKKKYTGGNVPGIDNHGSCFRYGHLAVLELMIFEQNLIRSFAV